eukprot:10620781-Karenia_brevis.AAC.1
MAEQPIIHFSPLPRFRPSTPSPSTYAWAVIGLQSSPVKRLKATLAQVSFLEASKASRASSSR